MIPNAPERGRNSALRLTQAPTVDAATMATLCAIACAAGQAILEVYHRPQMASRQKADASPITEADERADAIIGKALEQHFPGLPMLSEESGPPAQADASRGYFLVDPLDGTREFLARNGEFTVNIAWVNAQGLPVAGVVHTPALAQTHWGAQGLGAFVKEGAVDVHGQQGARRICVAPAVPPHMGLRVLASRSHGNDLQAAFLARLQPSPHLVLAGSSLKFCRIAEGAADLYPRRSPTAPWDTAAGQAVLQAAGGVVLSWPAEGATPCGLLAPFSTSGPAGMGLNPHFIAASSAALALRCIRAG